MSDENAALSPAPTPAAPGPSGSLKASRSSGGRVRGGRRPAWRGAPARPLVAAPLAILAFIFALRILVLSAGALVDVFEAVGAGGAWNFVGLGWLSSYLVLSGSPIAATALTLQDAGVLSEVEAFAQIVGSRLGASFIVLVVGFVSYLRGRRLADGVYVGVVSLVVTITTYVPVGIVGWLALDQGWFDGVEIGAIAPVLSFMEAVYDPILDPLRDALPDIVLFLVGIFLMLAALRLFDRALPTAESTSGRLASNRERLNGRWAMFGLGAGITLITLSVAVSLTLLVPLARQGLIRREAIVPYVLGANITTLADTLFASSVLESGATATVVLTVAFMATAAALFVLTVTHRPYVNAVNRTARWASQDRRHLATFIGAIFAAPVVLLVV